MTLTFDLFNSGSMRAERLPCTACLPSFVLIALAVFLLECGNTDPQTDTLIVAPDIWNNIPSGGSRGCPGCPDTRPFD